MAKSDKPLVWLRGEVESPPFSPAARVETGSLLRRLQQGETLRLPHSRPMPVIGPRCHELRVNDGDHTWRLVYHIATDAIVLLDVVSKKTPATPQSVIESCQKRLAEYQRLTQGKG